MTSAPAYKAVSIKSLSSAARCSWSQGMSSSTSNTGSSESANDARASRRSSRRAIKSGVFASTQSTRLPLKRRSAYSRASSVFP